MQGQGIDLEGIYATSDPLPMRTWKRTGNEGALGKGVRKDSLEKSVKLGGAGTAEKWQKTVKGPVERVGTYDPEWSLLYGREHTERNDSIEPVENEMGFC